MCSFLWETNFNTTNKEGCYLKEINLLWIINSNWKKWPFYQNQTKSFEDIANFHRVGEEEEDAEDYKFSYKREVISDPDIPYTSCSGLIFFVFEVRWTMQQNEINSTAKKISGFADHQKNAILA